ncbi:hypothetical protein [Cupriavidus sp. TMH.W2]|uniref:hypothetical protein n=1 Tax=Cupriavidus sp. TMH.W2 TaxID=3434465 RepID=UPI003D77FA5B
MAANIVSDKRKAQARKHAQVVHVCVCGKECRGNGGWSSHKRVCEQWKSARTAVGERDATMRSSSECG